MLAAFVEAILQDRPSSCDELAGYGATYLARLAEPLTADATQRLAAGLRLRNETRPTRPATLQRLTEVEVRITVQEGRYHLVRRMFAALGNRVLAAS